MTVDFTQLLDVKAEDVKRPPPKPVGTYILRIAKAPETTESRDKGTPGLQYTFNYVEALEDVDPELLAEVDLTKGTLRDTFWLTEEAQYRLKEFFEKMGLDIEGKTFAELVPDSVNMEIKAHVTQNPGRGGVIYNNIEVYLAMDEELAA